MSTPLADALVRTFTADSGSNAHSTASAQGGPSVSWAWRSLGMTLVFGVLRHLRTRPLYTLRALLAGWATMLVIFSMIDSPLVWRLRIDGYVTGQWLPFWTAACVISYTGFAVSAWVVTRFHLRAAGPLLIVHIGTVLVAMGFGASIVESARTSVPHLLFPLVSVALPYQERSGLLLTPAVMLLTGTGVVYAAHRSTASASTSERRRTDAD